MPEKIDKKIINNAIASYLMIIASWFFLINKSNPYLNNKFVRNHTKSAMIIHLLIILNYIIFISYWFLNNIVVVWYWLNLIIANIIFIFLLFILIYWIYKASKSSEFSIWNIIRSNKHIWLDINNDNKIDEKDKLSIILSHIPFIWYIIWNKYKNNKIENILRLNLFISIIITLIYIIWYSNIVNLLILIYIILIVFTWVNLFSRDELITINLPYYFSPNWKIVLQSNIIKYLINYFKWNFKEFREIVKESKIKKEKQELIEKQEIENLKDFKLAKFTIYIPILNLYLIFNRNNKYKTHIINWLIISLLTIILIILATTSIITSKILILILFPICFWLWKLWNNYYKMPYIYEIYLLLKSIKNIFIRSKKDLDTKRKEVNEVNLKVK